MKKKTIILISLFVVIIVAGVTACLAYMQYGRQSYKEIKVQALEIADAMESGDISKVTSLVFGSEELEIDEEIKKEFNQVSDTSEDGILKEIFKRNKIKVKQIEKETIEYEVEAPNMERVLQELQEQATGMTEEEVISYTKKYIEKAEKKKRTAVISYSLEGGKFDADYRNEEFINAITGGLIESYKVYYQGLLEAYRERLEE